MLSWGPNQSLLPWPALLTFSAPTLSFTPLLPVAHQTGGKLLTHPPGLGLGLPCVLITAL